MNYNILSKILRLIFLLLVQVLICNNIHLLGYASPLLIGYVIIAMGRNENRISLLLWGFCTGLIFDMFSNTAGMAASGMTLIAMIQPDLLQSVSPRDAEENMKPSIQAMGFWNYTTYAFTLMIILHSVYYFLDAFMLANIQLTLISALISAILATGLAIGVDMLTSTHRKY
ncbi:MAG: rod shape-determining protein MreD [Bacteroidaceae bacterium]|nr:rod shape-determining protein MreD [Bacteroidaceae bacterium]